MINRETKKIDWEFWENLRSSFYVDNCVISVQNVSEVENFMKTATEVMREGQYNLRGLKNNESSVCPPSSKTHVLGLIWNKDSDTLKIDSKQVKLEESTKLRKFYLS